MPVLNRDRTGLVQVVTVVESALVSYHVLQDRQDARLQIFPQACEPEDIFEKFVTNLYSAKFLVIQNMLLEELSLAIHMRTVEYTVAIDLLILERCGFLSG